MPSVWPRACTLQPRPRLVWQPGLDWLPARAGLKSWSVVRRWFWMPTAARVWQSDINPPDWKLCSCISLFFPPKTKQLLAVHYFKCSICWLFFPPQTAVLMQLSRHVWWKKVTCRLPRDAALSSHYHGVETRSWPAWLQLTFLLQQLGLNQHTDPPQQVTCSGFSSVLPRLSNADDPPHNTGGALGLIEPPFFFKKKMISLEMSCIRLSSRHLHHLADARGGKEDAKTRVASAQLSTLISPRRIDALRMRFCLHRSFV